MNSDRQIRVRALFDAAVELDSQERQAFLVASCGEDATLRGELDALLRAHECAVTDQEAHPAPARERAGLVLGHYRLIEEIGTGGFGTVWMAEQERPLRRRVAVKILKPGMDSAQVLARFDLERQALALMEHPNIAHVFDAGTTQSGRPYFVMELVRGVPITQYCDETHLTPKERLELFIPVCEAVQHAHQRGIIHRDLKPSNVLVTLHDGKPVPKVIDFGIAKATSGQLTERTVFTEFRQMLGTPEYMAPEQAELSGLDIDTRADVYSLGVLLYELLTGSKPFELADLLKDGYLAMVQRIKEVEPPKPSTKISTLGARLSEVAKHRRMLPGALSSLIRGELDWIVMKALEKDRCRRYVTALALGEDVQRYLDDQPVLASPPSRLYRARKFAWRHRIGVGAGAAVLVALLAGLGAATWGFFAAKEQEGKALEAAGKAEQRRLAAEAAELEAKAQAKKATTVIELLERMLGASNPSQVKGRDYKVRDLLDDFDRELGDSLAKQPEVETSVRLLLGRSYLGLAEPKRAQRHVERALALAESSQGGSSELGVRALETEANLRYDLGDLRGAVAIAERALSRAEAVAGPESPLAADIHALLADLVSHQGRVQEAVNHAGRAVAIGKALPTAPNPELYEHMAGLANWTLKLGDAKAAERIAQEAVAGAASLPSLHPARLHCTRVLARVMTHLSADAEAEKLARQDLAAVREAFGDQHSETASAFNSLGEVLRGCSRFKEAEECYRRSLAIRLAVHGEQSDSGVTGLHNLAMVLLDAERLDEALDLAKRALSASEAVYGAESPAIADQLTLVGDVLRALGRAAEAKAVFQRALPMQRETYGDDHLEIALLLNSMAMVSEGEEAVELFRKALAAALASEGEGHVHTQRIRGNLAMAYESVGNLAAAEREAEAQLAAQRRALAANHFAHAHPLVLLARHAARRGDQAKAKERLDELFALLEKQPERGDEDPEILSAAAGVLPLLGRLEEAAQLMRRVLAVREARSGAISYAVGETGVRLGLLQKQAGHQAEAEKTLRKAYEVLLATSGQGQEPTVWAGYQLADLLIGQHRIDEALTILTEIDRARRETKAVSVRMLDGFLRLLANAQLLAGDPASATATLREAESLLRSSGQAESPAMVNALGNQGMVAMRANQLDAAESLLLRAIALAKKLAGDHGDLVFDWEDELAECYLLQGRNERVEALVAPQIAWLRPQGEPHALRLAIALAQLGRALIPRDPVAAEAALRECLELRRARIPDHSRRWNAQSLLGAALVAQSKLAAAEPLLLESQEKLAADPEAKDRAREATLRIAELYERWQKADLATRWRAKAAGAEKK